MHIFTLVKVLLPFINPLLYAYASRYNLLTFN